MIIHRYDGRFANQIIQYILVKYYSIRHNNPTNFIQGNWPPFPNIVEYNNQQIQTFNPNKVYSGHDQIDYDTYYENVLFHNFFGMNPLNFEVVTDEIAKQMIPIKETEHSFQDGDVICAIRGGDVIGMDNKDYTMVNSQFYIDMVKKYKFERIFILGELNHSIPMQIANEIKQKFDNCQILEMSSVESDFQTFVNCPNLIGAYSSFYWLSAFLSNKQYAIFPKGRIMDNLYYPKFIYEGV